MLTTCLVAGSYLCTRLSIDTLNRWHHRLGAASEILLAWTVLATRSLQNEASSVLDALSAGDLVEARQRLSRIVGRDTESLGESEMARAVIETVAESTCDGVIAPLTFLTLGGVPAGMAYKAINTLDSMIGHRESPYTYFGRCSARVDDAANFVPARFTALCITAAAGLTGKDATGAWRVWRRDGWKHPSPNAGQGEAAMAGALGIAAVASLLGCAAALLACVWLRRLRVETHNDSK
ncbi:MAG: cobalamin biosynthesis protein CobD [Acidobacteria bacterium]|nr:cobalamin biosynthesis protein CobD [Acidobacteriota bacterium]